MGMASSLIALAEPVVSAAARRPVFRGREVLKHLLLMVSGLLMVFPFVWMLSGALKTNDEIFRHPLQLLPSHPDFSSFATVWRETHFGLFMYNSLTVALLTSLLVVVNSVLFAYAIVQWRGKAGRLLYGVVMACYMLPGAVTYIPCYIILAKLHVLDTHIGLIFSNAVSAMGVFYLHQALKKIHPSLMEAARIDGAGEWALLRTIVLPQIKPVLATLFLLIFITHYNSYMWPSLVITSPSLNLISIGIRQYFISGGDYGFNWSNIMAASAIVVMPMLFLFLLCQRMILSGFSDNGVKE
ncbi:carbohydrate ABC transporter permease [Dickeya dianthicola]|uniref:Carbohydrate ABC transporter permease n=2 Tax=Dickeya dianthicola TaxID=204039 RepID=A0AAP2D4B6_9GAMM|nr:carbohydrate ABC transporter permease [Dickeya dianthicola]MBI0451385.1 carbohydrate ABC transporter permease [Dickeya dianthicola]MBI0455613.1 carbohydrate ABC transporter permease [Dickeya dianthicola]MBI0460075.1 carbohydrate ABC transporter permease [Dickeya dianthicola]MBI0463112.1 carbohydrate ABC transporter permease [Dickeya dianthicola]